ncbi:pyrroline-5-carboxylate reductase family protein [Colwellia polaris]|jgi:pyrroline-5-carboxylate reductase|uniref:pyrroline-5-carboxylate reductase family protein n=1 Tax=Colwellia polaris TaxID=326537 RepID=UPI000A16D3B9|nr:pyrroline-5-carboxylate reductase dimerization domain-containing protein [Colwellia polaris]
MSLLMIGCGKMGSALLSRWATSTDQNITIINPSLVKAPAGVKVTQTLEELSGQRFDFVVIAIKPQLIAHLLPAYQAYLKSNACVISIAAGYSVTSLVKLIGERAIVRVMPSLPAQIGRGVSGIYANAICSDAQLTIAKQLTDAVGYTHITDNEDELDRVTAVARSGPGYTFEIARCWINSAINLVFSPKAAKALVLNTLGGSIELAIESKSKVTSKNGATQAGLDTLMKSSTLESLLDSTVLSAYERAITLR